MLWSLVRSFLFLNSVSKSVHVDQGPKRNRLILKPFLLLLLFMGLLEECLLLEPLEKLSFIDFLLDSL